MDHSPLTSEKHGLAERASERTIRWLLVPFYLGLAISLVVLLVKFLHKLVMLVFSTLFSGGSDVITAVLSLIDLSLIANLLLIVMFSGYENFVSRFELDDQKYKPAWMGHVGFGELKLKLLTSIIAISAVRCGLARGPSRPPQVPPPRRLCCLEGGHARLHFLVSSSLRSKPRSLCG